MPVVVASSTRSADALIGYALDDKPEQQGERYVMVSGVGGLLVSVARQQMRDVRKKWNKDKPGAFVQAYHVIQSFAKDELDPDDPDSWMTAQKLGQALAEDRFPGRQVLVVTQRDGDSGCLHNHLVANSVERKTGRSLNSRIVTHARLVEAHERILEEKGFEQRADLKQAFSDATERRERGEPSGLRRAGTVQRSELREFQQHILWEAECDIADEFGVSHDKQPFSLTVLKHSIEITLADPAVVDWDSFVAVGRSRGVQIEQRGKKGRGISYSMLREEPDGTLAEPTASDRRRCSTLGVGFDMDAFEEALASNRPAVPQVAATTPLASTFPSATPQVAVVTKDVLSGPRLSAKALMLAALEEADSEGDALSKQMVANHLKNKARLRQESQTLDVAMRPQHEDTVLDTEPKPSEAPVPDWSLTELDMDVTEQDAKVPGPSAVEAVVTPEAPRKTDQSIEELRGSESKRQPSGPVEVHDTKQKTSEEKRKRKRTYRKFFDEADAAPATDERTFGD